MYGIEKKDYGYRLTFGGSIGAEEMAQWLIESEQVLAEQSGTFSVFVDMRTLIPLSREAQVYMEKGQKLYMQKGMERSIVIVSSPATAAQFRRIAGETKIARWERYIDASSVPDWEEIGLNWIIKAIDPDKRRTAASTA